MIIFYSYIKHWMGIVHRPPGPAPPGPVSEASPFAGAIAREARENAAPDACGCRFSPYIIVEQMGKWIATQENSGQLFLYLFGGYYSIVVSADAVSSGAEYAGFGHGVGH